MSTDMKSDKALGETRAILKKFRDGNWSADDIKIAGKLYEPVWRHWAQQKRQPSGQ